jgi:hypothetical protein
MPHGCQHVFRIVRAGDETDSATRRSVPQPTAIVPNRCRVSYCAWPARARCGGHETLAGASRRHRHGHPTHTLDDTEDVLSDPAWAESQEKLSFRESIWLVDEASHLVLAFRRYVSRPSRRTLRKSSAYVWPVEGSGYKFSRACGVEIPPFGLGTLPRHGLRIFPRGTRRRLAWWILRATAWRERADRSDRDYTDSRDVARPPVGSSLIPPVLCPLPFRFASAVPDVLPALHLRGQSGISAALSFKISIISSRLPGRSVIFAINPHMLLASCEPLEQALAPPHRGTPKMSAGLFAPCKYTCAD